MLGYAYRDKNDILHVTKDKKTAQEYAKGKVVAVNCEYGGGYLKVLGKNVFDYGGGKIYWGGNEKSGKALAECDQAIAEAIKIELKRIGI